MPDANSLSSVATGSAGAWFAASLASSGASFALAALVLWLSVPAISHAGAEQAPRAGDPAAAPAGAVAPAAARLGALVPPPAPVELAALRARGPAGLAELLARFDRLSELNPLPAPAAWDAAIDSVAGQRYATVSRLYWYTDLAAAQDEARRQHRPILALRMLGDLRDDLSCANSRLFRATLYANTEVAALLRDRFVLYWSSERPVPRVTIEFGDGRKLVRTTTGNSAHYVLDADGQVIDVLPGLYAPAVFRAELARSADLAAVLHSMSAARRPAVIQAHHAARIAQTDRAWAAARGAQYIRRAPFLADAAPLARAQALTASKAVIEVPDLQAIGALDPGEVPDDSAAWSAIGQKVWQIRSPITAARAADPAAARIAAVPARMVLDDASAALVERIHDAGPGQRSSAAELAAVIARLEQHIVADTAKNEFQLRPMIRRRLAQGVTGFAPLNEWIYETVFATPAADPWLGLRARSQFTGLPGDGVVMP